MKTINQTRDESLQILQKHNKQKKTKKAFLEEQFLKRLTEQG